MAEDIQPRIAYLREAVSLLPDDHPLSCSFQETQEAILTALRKSDPGEEKAVLDDARRRLDGLKREYREIYLKAHRQARLDGEDDRRKSRLMGDTRWQSLRLLAREIPWLSAKKLGDLEARLSGLISCWRLVEGDLDREPRCPHCQFRPADLPAEPVRETLRHIDEELDRLRTEWVKALQEALRSPTAQESLGLMAPEERARLETLRDQGKWPEPLDEAFLQTLARALKGLERVSLPPEDILHALTRPRMPCTVEELRHRFEDFLRQRLAGKDPDWMRVVIEW